MATTDPHPAASARPPARPEPRPETARAVGGALDPAAIGRFESLLNRSEQLRIGGLRFDDLRELGALYRLYSAELARLRDREDDPERVHHLNALCVRAYAFLYGGQRAARPGGSVRSRLPAALAATWRAQLLAWGLLLLGLFLGAALSARDADAVYALTPAALGYSSERVEVLLASQAARERFFARRETPVARNAFFGSQLFAHNTRVGLLSFAVGTLAGIPTALLQLYNGLMLGAFSALFLREGSALLFLAWILPHGVPELTAITFCAAGGLVFGAAVATPGRRRRRDAIRDAADPALLLFLGSVPLFLLAALIESFVRESALGTAPRLGVAAGMLLLVGGITLAARRQARRRAAVDAAWLRELLPAPTSRAPDPRGPAGPPR